MHLNGKTICSSAESQIYWLVLVAGLANFHVWMELKPSEEGAEKIEDRAEQIIDYHFKGTI